MKKSAFSLLMAAITLCLATAAWALEFSADAVTTAQGRTMNSKMFVKGVRSSCDTSAVKRLSSAKEFSSCWRGLVEDRGQFAQVVMGVDYRQPLIQRLGREPAGALNHFLDWRQGASGDDIAGPAKEEEGGGSAQHQGEPPMGGVARPPDTLHDRGSEIGRADSQARDRIPRGQPHAQRAPLPPWPHPQTSSRSAKPTPRTV